MTQSAPSPTAQPGKPKLLDQVRQRCRVRHMAYSTEQAYVNWIRRYVIFHHVRHPLEMGVTEVSQYLTLNKLNITQRAGCHMFRHSFHSRRTYGR